MTPFGESGLDLLGQHTAVVAMALTGATVCVFAAYSWLIARGGTDGFLRWLDAKAAEECEGAARRFWQAFQLKDEKDPSAGLSMVVDGLEAFRRATARAASRRRAILVCEWAFAIMVLSCVGLWATLIGGPQWMQAIPFLAWVISATMGALFAMDLFRFVKKTGGPPPSEAKPVPPQAAPALPPVVTVAQVVPASTVRVAAGTAARPAQPDPELDDPELPSSRASDRK